MSPSDIRSCYTAQSELMHAPTNAALSAGPGRSSKLVSTMGVMRLLSVVLERTAKKTKPKCLWLKYFSSQHESFAFPTFCCCMEDEVHHEVREMTCCSGWVVAAGKQDSMAICEVMTRTETRGAATRQNASKSYGDRSTIASRRCNVAIMFARKFTTTDYIKESLGTALSKRAPLRNSSFFAALNRTTSRFPATLLWHSMHCALGVALFLLFAVQSSTFAVRAFPNRLLRRQPRHTRYIVPSTMDALSNHHVGNSCTLSESLNESYSCIWRGFQRNRLVR